MGFSAVLESSACISHYLSGRLRGLEYLVGAEKIVRNCVLEDVMWGVVGGTGEHFFWRTLWCKGTVVFCSSVVIVFCSFFVEVCS